MCTKVCTKHWHLQKRYAELQHYFESRYESAHNSERPLQGKKPDLPLPSADKYHLKKIQERIDQATGGKEQPVLAQVGDKKGFYDVLYDLYDKSGRGDQCDHCLKSGESGHLSRGCGGPLAGRTERGNLFSSMTVTNQTTLSLDHQRKQTEDKSKLLHDSITQLKAQEAAKQKDNIYSLSDPDIQVGTRQNHITGLVGVIGEGTRTGIGSRCSTLLRRDQ
ncbi:putative UMP-CMP kinase 2 [Labeo rohita]|uniref:UMP-CMP kinase 2 n=1 Tax=Labeo rohita TaxID=84645 RepID=A0ABQ8MHF4_LABRO|nr:putative UMP-CMP kinase 2 [Labeo rohita]